MLYPTPLFNRTEDHKGTSLTSLKKTSTELSKLPTVLAEGSKAKVCLF